MLSFLKGTRLKNREQNFFLAVSWSDLGVSYNNNQADINLGKLHFPFNS